MKFGKRLQSQLEETLPEWRDKYLSYKQLKKRLKLISAPECFTKAAFSSPLREQPESGSNSVVDAAVEVLRRGQADEELRQQANQAESAGAGSDRSGGDPAAESQDSSVNGAATVTEDTARKSSSGSGGTYIPHGQLYDSGALDMRNLTAEEVDFINLLNAELEKFNTFFIEKEEEYVIRLQELKERIESVKEQSKVNGVFPAESGLNEELIKIRKDIVNFHGEMVLLENYSSLNYTGLVKILKKHDKCTGALMRLPFIQNVLHQPFFTTELLSKLVHECEINLQSLFPSTSTSHEPSGKGSDQIPPADGAERDKQLTATDKSDELASRNQSVSPADVEAQVPCFSHGEDVENIYRSTVAALRTIKELRSGSSTYSVFSLPPFNHSGNDSSEDGKGTPCFATIPVCPKK